MTMKILDEKLIPSISDISNNSIYVRCSQQHANNLPNYWVVYLTM